MGDDIQFTLGLVTIPAVADSEFLDRLAELVYDIDELVVPLLGLNEDGSISASFEVRASTAHEAVDVGLKRFMDAFVKARPQRQPTPEWAAVPSFGVSPAHSLAETEHKVVVT